MVTKAVVVTTEHRGVFFGYMDKGHDPLAKTITLTGCRMVLYWASGGMPALAVNGPPSGSNVTIANPEPVHLRDVTSVMECTEKATEEFERYEAV